MMLTVKKLLNARNGRPSVNAPKVSELPPGTVVDVFDKPVTGDFYDGNNLWYKDKSKEVYYWSGGFFEMSKELPWWIKEYGIDEIWKLTKGKDVTIAIIDTGIESAHPDLSSAIIERVDITKSDGNANDIDGHGTHCAGIIAGRGIMKTMGVAPESNLLVVKTMNRSISYDKLKKSLEYLNGKEIDLLSISAGIYDDEEGFHEIIKGFIKDGIPVIAAIGNDGRKGTDCGEYPARYSECISVGSVDQNKLISNDTDKNPILTVCAPGENIESCLPGNSFGIKSGSSMATAFTSGVIALYLSWLKQKNISVTCEELKNKIITTSLKSSTNDFAYSIINPKELFK